MLPVNMENRVALRNGQDISYGFYSNSALLDTRRLVPLNTAASRSPISKLWNWHPQQMG